ncbi:hypothetical protein SASPL_143282 [Salvia splendens]|uniref:Uncharacterized protein n=1 Tax=Salvia splendens TaxID=180675 RepID=A0A8X8WLB0_SALSN|nr:hypothetical protein SASPL_143282 [Salvia splendens]
MDLEEWVRRMEKEEADVAEIGSGERGYGGVADGADEGGGDGGHDQNCLLIRVFYLSTLPNTLVMGIPLLKGMYGADSGSLMYRGARSLISEQFPDTTASIISFRVDTDVISLDGKEPLETQVEVGEDGKLHVNVRKSTSSRSENCIQ